MTEMILVATCSNCACVVLFAAAAAAVAAASEAVINGRRARARGVC